MDQPTNNYSQEAFTIDSIWKDEIRIKQSRHGYRFAVDAVLLAHFIRTESADTLLEVGCGNGVIPVLLSHLLRFDRLVAVELQPGLCGLARENFAMNRLLNVELVEGDIREVAERLSPKSFDLIYSNPPYRIKGSGKLNPAEEKAIARHEIRMKLADLFDVSERLLKANGMLSIILPDFREQDLAKLVQQRGFHWRERKYAHSFAQDPPAFLLSTISRQDGPCIERPPLVIYDAPGRYTRPMLELLRADPQTNASKA